MSDGISDSNPAPDSWVDRIRRALAGEPDDRTQIIATLRNAQQRELLDADALTMIEGVLQTSEMQVRDVMIPRAQMVVLEKDQSLEQILPRVIESAHSRFPVIDENRDEIEGILLAKDLLPFCTGATRGDFHLHDLLRPPVFIPESKRLNVLLRDFRTNRRHMAIVADEYGGVAGLVTIEDVLEQIVGDIEDEYDVDEEDQIKRFSDTRFTVKALTPVEDFNEYFGVRLEDEEFDTMGGLVIHHLGHLPRRGETLSIEGFLFKILHADNRRIHLLEVNPADTGSGPVDNPTRA